MDVPGLFPPCVYLYFLHLVSLVLLLPYLVFSFFSKYIGENRQIRTGWLHTKDGFLLQYSIT